MNLYDFLEAEKHRMAKDAVEGLQIWLGSLPLEELAREKEVDKLLSRIAKAGDKTRTKRIYLINVQNECAKWDYLPPPEPEEEAEEA